MVLTDRILAIHLPKTGGTWLRYVLRDLCGGRHKVGTHAPLSQAGGLEVGRLVVGTVRHPLPYYVSLYTYAMSGTSASEAVRAYGGGSFSWPDFLWGVTHPASVTQIPRAAGVIYNPHHPDPQTALGQSTVGLCTWLHRHAYGRSGLDISLRTSSLAVDLHDRLGVDARGRPPANTRRDLREGSGPALGPVDWRAWYTPRQRAWVAAADGTLAAWIERGAPTGDQAVAA